MDEHNKRAAELGEAGLDFTDVEGFRTQGEEGKLNSFQSKLEKRVIGMVDKLI